jgi:hypothetical protein
MTKDARRIEINASWDKHVIPANRPKLRSLLIDVSSLDMSEAG